MLEQDQFGHNVPMLFHLCMVSSSETQARHTVSYEINLSAVLATNLLADARGANRSHTSSYSICARYTSGPVGRSREGEHTCPRTMKKICMCTSCYRRRTKSTVCSGMP